jgi:hypothetical protein
MPGRPSKPIGIYLADGNKRHLTKKEIELREGAEKKLLSGYEFEEWDSVKDNIYAHKEFIRLKKLFKKIDKDDALHESSINRFCLLHAECIDLMEKIQANNIASTWLENEKCDMDVKTYIDSKFKLTEEYMKLDRQLMQKRKAMLDLERENIMTIAAALRTIPKKVEAEESVDPMARFISQRG